jgi:sigma-B regulation protein RsbU (phosphoserine phosphatase)
MEGSRFFAAHTEIQLAAEIQKQLVPPIEQNTAGWEFYGASIPSGAVGGDLLDVIVSGESFCAYVADVAGHGVSAGVLMSMVKSAVRMRLASIGSFGDGLSPLNEVLHDLTSDASYVTFAYITGDGNRQLTFSLAAHPPIFHYPHLSKRVERHSVENLPLGMLGHASYKTASIDCGTGDVLAIVTDGLVEVFDRQDRGIGSDYIEKILVEAAAEP